MNFQKVKGNWIFIFDKEIMFLVLFVCLSVWLFVSNITKISYKQIAMKFYEGTKGGKKNK